MVLTYSLFPLSAVLNDRRKLFAENLRRGRRLKASSQFAPLPGSANTTRAVPSMFRLLAAERLKLNLIIRLRMNGFSIAQPILATISRIQWGMTWDINMSRGTGVFAAQKARNFEGFLIAPASGCSDCKLQFKRCLD